MATTGDKERKDSRNPSETNQGRGSRTQSGRTQSSSTQSSRTQNGRVPIAEAMRLAAGQLAELLQCDPGSVSSVKPTDEGWTADVEVVEVERIPETTSVMGSYRVQLDTRGNLLGYERTRRYARGQIDQRK